MKPSITMPRLLRTANFRLALSYALMFGASVVVLGAIAYFDVRRSLEDQLRLHVSSEVEQLLHDYREDGLDELRHDIRERIENNDGQRLRYSVANADGKSIFDALPHTSQQGWHRITEQKRHLLAFTQPLDRGYRFTVAADMEQIRAVERAMLHACLLIVLGSLAFGVTGGLIMSNRFLTRVDALSRTAESIGRGDLSQRIATDGSGDDFDQLATTINRMLERIEVLMNEVRHVSTSIAHDMRTPLTRLRYKLERLGDSGEVAEALALLDETLATFSALLQLAELESGARRQHFTRVDLSQVLEQLAEAYEPTIEGSFTRRIAPHIHIHGDANLLRQLFANLIENAMRHGGAPLDLCLELRREGNAAIVRVADHGPGIPPERHAEVLRPFQRLDTSRTTRGNGLGLSLVTAILRLHESELYLSDNQPGLALDIQFRMIA